MSRIRRVIELLAVVAIAILVFLACTEVSPGTEETQLGTVSSTPAANMTPAVIKIGRAHV